MFGAVCVSFHLDKVLLFEIILEGLYFLLKNPQKENKPLNTKKFPGISVFFLLLWKYEEYR